MKHKLLLKILIFLTATFIALSLTFQRKLFYREAFNYTLSRIVIPMPKVSIPIVLKSKESMVTVLELNKSTSKPLISKMSLSTHTSTLSTQSTTTSAPISPTTKVSLVTKLKHQAVMKQKGHVVKKVFKGDRKRQTFR